MMTILQFVLTVTVGVVVALGATQGTFSLVRRLGWTGFPVWVCVTVISVCFILFACLVFESSSWISVALRTSGTAGSFLGAFAGQQVNAKKMESDNKPALRDEP